MSQATARGERVLCGDGHDLVVDGRVERLRHEAGADALDLVGAGLAAGEHRRVGGLNGNNLYLRVLLLEVAAGAGDGAAGAHAGNQDVDLAVGVLPNLRTRGRLMDGGVGGVHKLAGDHALGGLARQLLGLGDSALHAQRALGQHQLGTVAAHKLAALHAHGLGMVMIRR